LITDNSYKRLYYGNSYFDRATVIRPAIPFTSGLERVSSSSGLDEPPGTNDNKLPLLQNNQAWSSAAAAAVS